MLFFYTQKLIFSSVVSVRNPLTESRDSAATSPLETACGMVELNSIVSPDSGWTVIGEIFHSLAAFISSVGNTIKDTAGCPLCGFGFGFVDGNYQVSQSVAAYKMIYPKLVALAREPNNKIVIENNFQF